ncbi:MAG: transporter, partial [Saprospiraceae bacterium]|nr:transporter [Saprospiraceae bacterium]
MKRCLISFLLAFIVLQLKAQLSLDSCLYLAKTYFPAIQQIAIYDKILSEQLSNVNRNWIPAIQGTAQATYQSDVTSLNLNLPGFPAITPPPKDQYKFFIDASQLIYDGGSNVSQKNILRSINSA